MSVMFTDTAGGVIPARFVEETDPPMPDPTLGSMGVGTASAYDVALSRVLAEKVSEQDWRVLRFRARQLGGHLLAWEDVETWMRARAERAEGAAAVDVTTRYVLLPVSAEALWQAQERVQARTPGKVTFEIPDQELLARNPWPRAIFYAAPGDAIPRRQHVKEGTEVEALLQLVTHLIERVPWTEPQATVFVLTGLTPLITPLRIEWKQYGFMPTLPRILLEGDPRVTQRELAAVYERSRAQFSADIRHRDLSEKHLELAVFGTLPEGRDGALAQRMERWNTAHPAWAYQRMSNFSRDLIRARRRLLRDLPPYPPGEPDAHDEPEAESHGGEGEGEEE